MNSTGYCYHPIAFHHDFQQSTSRVMPHVKLSAESSQNLNLYYDVHGTGKTKILFIMGLLAEGSAWFRQVEFFVKKPEYQCVTFDNRGYGRSSTPFTFHYSTTQMAKDALGLINHLQWDQCHVVGISMGGMIALELALLEPRRLLSLTLLATHAGGLAGRAPLIGVRNMARSIFSRDECSVIEGTLSMLYSSKTLTDPDKRKSFHEYHTQKYRNRIKPSLIGIIGQTISVYKHFVSYADLLKIRYAKFPCLIIVGTEDRLVREENSYIIRRVLGCRLVKLDDTGHGLQGERASEVNHELLHLFESIRNHEQMKREIPEEYQTEIQALEKCCQHRSHCFIYDLVGLAKGLIFGMLLYIISLTIGSSIGISLTVKNVVLFGCLAGFHRSVKCVYHALQARSFVKKHHLELDRAAHHGGIGVSLPEERKNGVPQGCGFAFPVHSLVIIANLISLMYWTTIYEQK